MIRKIQIKNFKSIVDMELNLGRFNVLIGENGGGKSNVLEAIAFGGMSLAGTLTGEFFYRRGVRPGLPELVLPKFNADPRKEIILRVWGEGVNGAHEPRYLILVPENGGGKWNNAEFDYVKNNLLRRISKLLSEENTGLDELDIELRNAYLEADKSGRSKEDATHEIIKGLKEIYKEEFHDYERFVIFAPENTTIRKFMPEDHTLPLGFNGEGLFDHLKELMNIEGYKQGLEEFLSLLGWFDSITIPQDFFEVRRVEMKDIHFAEGQIMDQRNANEGFLFLLFYYVLFTSPHTPKFFAIDNIEASFNPKLCRKVIRELYKLAVMHDKQVILTTHNPFILDGLNLEDPEQKLITIERSIDGPTMAYPMDRPIQGPRKIALSEAWMMGLLGGLPNNF